jgi:hypothetical protein
MSPGHRNSKNSHNMVDTNDQDMVYTFSLEEVFHAPEEHRDYNPGRAPGS